MLQSLKGFQSEATFRYATLLRETGLLNIFNPSFACSDSLLAITFRGIAPGDNIIRAYLLTQSLLDQSIQLKDLTKQYALEGIGNVADPKLFHFNGNLWITFNTGWHPDNNDIFIAKITPSLEAPVRCIFSGRQKIEKNWAFYGSGETLRAIYSLQGPVLQATSLSSSFRNDVEMTQVGIVKSSRSIERYSIGTQLVWLGDDAYLVAHRKIQIFGKRLYLGKLMKLTFNENDIQITQGSKYIFHSWTSLMGSRLKYNKNLLSCSYFSGLYLVNDNAQLGYGVNDVTFHFSEISLGSLL